MKANLKPHLCLIEDDVIMGESLVDRFQIEGFGVDWYQNGSEALERFRRCNPYAAVISDIRLSDVSGDELFRCLFLENPALPPFIFITGYGSIDAAVRLLKWGARDYITKPFDIDELVEKVRTLIEPRALQFPADPTGAVLGVSAVMRGIEARLPQLARHDATVLLTGETGVGKEHVARLLHAHAPGPASRPFVAVNCAAFPETLLDAELFGHEKGAFTGAVRARKGLFEQAHGGTLFLDEIGEMPSSMQAKLLRAVQERVVVRLGSEAPIPVNVRLICATNRNLKEQVEQGAFRADLYYRINVIELKIPLLQERKEDILWFARKFVDEYNQRHPEERKALSPCVEQALLGYSWPGNIRELKHTLERACILASRTMIVCGDLFEDRAHRDVSAADGVDNLNRYLYACERAHITRALEKHGWHIGNTSAGLGISRKNLWEKMKKLQVREKS